MVNGTSPPTLHCHELIPGIYATTGTRHPAGVNLVPRRSHQRVQSRESEELGLKEIVQFAKSEYRGHSCIHHVRVIGAMCSPRHREQILLLLCFCAGAHSSSVQGSMWGGVGHPSSTWPREHRSRKVTKECVLQFLQRGEGYCSIRNNQNIPASNIRSIRIIICSSPLTSPNCALTSGGRW